MKRKLIVAAAALAVLVMPVVVHAEPVQQFSFQLKGIKPDGRFVLLFNSRAFDTTGQPPPNPIDSYLRLPAGATIRKQFLNSRYYCNGTLLRHSIDSRPGLSYRPFTKLVANLGTVIKVLAKDKTKSGRAQLKNAQTCDRARIGGGTAKFDPRTLNLPALSELIPANFSVFFAKPSAPGAVAGFTVLGAAVESDPVVKRTPIVAAVHAVLGANFINDPSPDGLYGYKLILPPSSVNGLDVRLAELHVTTTGLTLLKGQCLKQGRHGHCAKRQKKTIFWFTQPKCPASGKISFLAFYSYAPPTQNVTSTFQLPCPKFR